MSARWPRVFLALFGLLGGLTLAQPSILLDVLRTTERGLAGLDEGSMTLDDHQLVYLRGGEGPPVVLLHGFSADKDNWTRLSRHLTSTHDVIVPDLPGHGQSSRLDASTYDIRSQAERVHQMITALTSEPVHLVGNSMGGHIATWMAVEHPEQLASLTLICPGGVTSPQASEMQVLARQGLNPLLVEDAEDYDRLLDFVFVEPPYIPGPTKAYFAEMAVKHRPFHEKIWRDLHEVPAPLEPQLPHVQAPTLVLWGDTDRVLDPSGARVFAEGIPHAEVQIMDATGHVPMIERPADVAQRLLPFWAAHLSP